MPSRRRRGKLSLLPVDVLHIYHEHDAPRGADDLRERIHAKARELGLRHRVVAWSDEATLRTNLGDVEVLFTSSPPRGSGLWSGARRLRLIQMMGVGVDELLPAPDLPEGVAITCLRGVFAAEVSEHVFAMALALVRGVSALVARQAQREWRAFASGRLEGRTMGIVGFGTIGRRVATIAEAFGMRVVTLSRRRGSLREVMRASDVLVVCLPRTPETTGLVDRAAIAELPSGALVVNVGRGGIVDELALRDALDSGAVGGAAIDVFDEEPLSATSPWWGAPNTIVTPHIAGFGLAYEARAALILLENVRRLEAGDELLHRVDRRAGY